MTALNSWGSFVTGGRCASCSNWVDLRMVVDGDYLCRDCAVQVAETLLQQTGHGPYQSAEDAAEDYDAFPAYGDGGSQLRLVAACAAAGVELDQFDHQALIHLSNGCEPAVVQALAGLILRAAAR